MLAVLPLFCLSYYLALFSILPLYFLYTSLLHISSVWLKNIMYTCVGLIYYSYTIAIAILVQYIFHVPYGRGAQDVHLVFHTVDRECSEGVHHLYEHHDNVVVDRGPQETAWQSPLDSIHSL